MPISATSKTNIYQTLSEEKILRTQGYKLFSKIASGSHAVVFLGEFKATNDKPFPLACKIIDKQKAPKNFVKKFLPRELKILVKINHPHIINVHSIFTRKQKYFIFMRHAEKGDLLQFLLKNGALKQDQARIWVRQLALAIQYLHTLEIAHRDLKCENILITKNFNVKISDFGFARYLLSDDRRRLQSETYCGTLSYAAPEILRGKPYNPKISDMWSLGVIIYTMLNKLFPFENQAMKTLYNNQMKKNWKFRAKYAGKLCEEVKDLITNLLEPEPLQRLKIEQVVNSSFIAMDPKLKTMTSYEFEALSGALEEAKSPASVLSPEEVSNRRSTIGSITRRTNRSFSFYKEYDGGGFNIEALNSEYNRNQDTVSV